MDVEGVGGSRYPWDVMSKIRDLGRLRSSRRRPRSFLLEPMTARFSVLKNVLSGRFNARDDFWVVQVAKKPSQLVFVPSIAISQHDQIADIHTRRGLRKNQSTGTKINSSKPGGNQMTQQNSDEAQEDRPAEQESQPDSDANDNGEGIQHDNPDNPNHRRENEYDEGRRLITVPVLGTALAVAAIIAAGAIGYIIGTYGEQARIPAAPPAIVQTIPQATTQQFRYPESTEGIRRWR